MSTTLVWVKKTLMRDVRGAVLHAYLCPCGNGVFALRPSVVEASKKSCGNCQFGHGDAKRWLAKRIERQYIRGAVSRDIHWSLTFEEVERLVYSNCYYCNASPKRESHVQKPGSRNPKLAYAAKGLTTNGIDRLDSRMGYTGSNCVSCCTDCNRAKWELSESAFLQLIRRVYAYRCG